ncbi:MAG TPA: catalase family peroxidase [Candidatus Udaeobacter sp.]|nr:catalase family peroxidase [Candidatus Udaeobacter sp.]
MNQPPKSRYVIYMRALLSFIVSTTSVGSSLLAGVAAAAEPFNWSPQVDDPIHTPAELVESMHSAFGYNHCRAVNAKGVIFQGEFTPDSHAKEITKAPHLQGPSSSVTVRFSDFSGVPTIPDNDPMANPRGLAIRFELPGGASTDLVAHSFNGFPVSNTDDLRELMLAIAASGPCAATPTALDRFLEFHPTARAFLAAQKTPASFATISYYGVGSFKFINAKGEGHYVRYQVVSDAGEQLLRDEEREKQSANYLMDEIKTRVAAAPIGFALYAQVAEHGDRINDPSIAWPHNRKRVLLGRLEIKKLTANTAEEDRRLVFDPSNVPTGIETADMLSSFYSKAFRLSAEEERDVAPVARN